MTKNIIYISIYLFRLFPNDRILRENIKLVFVSNLSPEESQRIKGEYPLFFEKTRTFQYFGINESLQKTLLISEIRRLEIFEQKTLEDTTEVDSEPAKSGSQTEERDEASRQQAAERLVRMTSAEALLREEQEMIELQVENLSLVLVEVGASLKREETESADQVPASGWRNLVDVLQKFGMLLPNKKAVLENQIKRLSDSLDFLGDIDKESFEREKRIDKLKTEVLQGEKLIRRLSKREKKKNRELHQTCKKMKEILRYSKLDKPFKDLSGVVKILLKNVCKVKQQNYEANLDQHENPNMRAVVLRGNRSSIGLKLLNSSSVISKIKFFWEYGHAAESFKSISFESISETFESWQNKENKNRFYLLSVISTFTNYIDSKFAGKPEPKKKGGEEEPEIDFKFLAAFYSKMTPDEFLNKLFKLKVKDLNCKTMTQMTRDIILFNEEARIKTEFGSEILHLNKFIKRLMIHLRKEIRFIDKLIFKGKKGQAEKAKLAQTLAPDQSSIDTHLTELFTEFFSQQDARSFLQISLKKFHISRSMAVDVQKTRDLDSELRSLLMKRKESDSIGAKLSNEMQSWRIDLDKTRDLRLNLEGNCLLGLCILDFCPKFSISTRQRLILNWTAVFQRRGLSTSADFDVSSFLLSPMERGKILFRCPLKKIERFENLLLIEESSDFLALVDPHGLCPVYLELFFKESERITCRVSAPDAAENIKKAIVAGQLLLLKKDEDEKCSQAVAHLLDHLKEDESGSSVFHCGGSTIQVHDNFKCFFLLTSFKALDRWMHRKVRSMDMADVLKRAVGDILMQRLRRRELGDDEELRQGLLYEKLEETFQVESLKNELLGKILDLIRERNSGDCFEEERGPETQEDLINVSEALNITKMTIRQREKETDLTLRKIDEKKEKLELIVKEFEDIYSLHRQLQASGRACAMGAEEMFNLVFGIVEEEEKTKSFDLKMMLTQDVLDESNEETEPSLNPAGSVLLPKKPEKKKILKENQVRKAVSKLSESVHPEARLSFFFNSALRIENLRGKVRLSELGVMMVVLKLVYLENSELMVCGAKTANRDSFGHQVTFKGLGFWNEPLNKEEILEKDSDLSRENELEQTVEDVWKQFKLESKVVFNLSKEMCPKDHASFSESQKENEFFDNNSSNLSRTNTLKLEGELRSKHNNSVSQLADNEESQGLSRFFESSFLAQCQTSLMSGKLISSIDKKKQLLLEILEQIGGSPLKGLLSKVKMNVMKDKGRGCLLNIETRVKDLRIDLGGEQISCFLRFLLLSIFHPHAVTLYMRQYVESVFGSNCLRTRNTFKRLSKMIQSRLGRNVLVNLSKSHKQTFIEDLITASEGKQMDIVTKKGRFPISKEFLSEFGAVRLTSSVRSDEEENYLKIWSAPSTMDGLDWVKLEEYFKRSRFQSKVVVIDLEDDRKALRLLSNVLNNGKSTETEEGFVVALWTGQDTNACPFTYSTINYQNSKVSGFNHQKPNRIRYSSPVLPSLDGRRLFTEPSKQCDISGNVFSTESEVFTPARGVKGFENWIFYKPEKKIAQIFERNLAVLVDEFVELVEEFNTNQAKDCRMSNVSGLTRMSFQSNYSNRTRLSIRSKRISGFPKKMNMLGFDMNQVVPNQMGKFPFFFLFSFLSGWYDIIFSESMGLGKTYIV